MQWCFAPCFSAARAIFDLMEPELRRIVRKATRQ